MADTPNNVQLEKAYEYIKNIIERVLNQGFAGAQKITKDEIGEIANNVTLLKKSPKKFQDLFDHAPEKALSYADLLRTMLMLREGVEADKRIQPIFNDLTLDPKKPDLIMQKRPTILMQKKISDQKSKLEGLKTSPSPEPQGTVDDIKKERP